MGDDIAYACAFDPSCLIGSRMAFHDVVTADGLRWRIVAPYQDVLLGPSGLRLAEWLADGSARLVKQNAQRAIYRVHLPGLSFYLKQNRISNSRAWLRDLVRAPKAAIEYDRACQLAARGVKSIEPIAVGVSASWRPGDSYLLTRTLEFTKPLSTYLESTLPALPQHARLRHQLAKQLGQLMARLHQAGVRHDDLHPGNILIRHCADGSFELVIIDLHAAHLSTSLSWSDRRDNLVMLNRWFILRANRSDRLRFWLSYLSMTAGHNLNGEQRHRALDLEERTWESNSRFWKHRDRRCLVSNRYYRKVTAKSIVGHTVSDLDSTSLAELLHDPDAIFTRPGAMLLKDGRSSTVAELTVTVGGVPTAAILKRFRVTSAADPLRALVRRSPAVRSWVFGHGLRERRLPTPRPLAILRCQQQGLTFTEYLLTEKVAEAVDLAQFMAVLQRLSGAERQSRLREAIDQLARLVRELHRRRLRQRDLKASNILVQLSRAGVDSFFGPFFLIDLVGVHYLKPTDNHSRLRDLTRLHASFTRTTILTRSDKLRLLRVYLQCGLFGRHTWKQWWRAIDQATVAKIERNRRSGRPLC